MGYQHKVTIYGHFIQTKEYSKEVCSNKLSRPCFSPPRVYDPFRKRRLNNVYSSKRAFVQRVCCGLDSLGSPLFATFTYAENFGDIGLGNRHFRAFVLRLRKVYPSFQYVVVPEFQKRGALHYHALLFGLPSEWGDLTGEPYKDSRGKIKRKILEYGSERSSRFLASLWVNGFVDVVRTDGSSRLAGYLAKYMEKASQYLPSSVRSYNFSNAFPKVTVLKGTDEVLLQKFQKGVPLYESRYQAPWLGGVIVKTYVRN